jgi:hypothetical protein
MRKPYSVTVFPLYLDGSYAERQSFPSRFRVSPEIKNLTIDSCIFSNANSTTLKIQVLGWGILRVKPKFHKDWVFCSTVLGSGLYLPGDTELALTIPKCESLEISYWNIFGKATNVFNTPAPDEEISCLDPATINSVPFIEIATFDLPSLDTDSYKKSSVNHELICASIEVIPNNIEILSGKLQPSVRQEEIRFSINMKSLPLVNEARFLFRPKEFIARMTTSLKRYLSSTKFD